MFRSSGFKSSDVHPQPQNADELNLSDLEHVVGGTDNAEIGGALVSGCCYQNSPGGEWKYLDWFFYLNYL